jgi:hypothetical protein
MRIDPSETCAQSPKAMESLRRLQAAANIRYHPVNPVDPV